MIRDGLVVGINSYEYTRLGSLKAPAEDAEAIAQILSKSGDFHVSRLPEISDKENNTTRVGRKTKVVLTQLEEALVRLFKPTGDNIPDTALFYFSGHGLRKDRGIQEGFLATSDVNPDLNNWGLRLKWLRELLQESPVRQQIVLLDCCYSGELLNFDEADPGERGKGRDRCFIAASREYELAYEETTGNHGVLTKALLQGLDPTRQLDGVVSNFTLVDFIKQSLQGATQRPIYANSGGQILLTGKGVEENPVLEGICPYKGLVYFDCNDEDPKYFHGRTALTDQLLEKIRQSNFLAVVGASGSGKSSVVRAGLLHQLKLGQRLSGSDRWVVKIFRPGKHPLQSLAWTFVDSALSEIDQANQAAKAEDLLEAGAVGLSRIVKAFNVDRVILVIDQFEEVFTLCKDAAERQRFFECLLNTNKRLGNEFTVVLAIRADFYGKCAEQHYAGLVSKIQTNLVTVTPMNQEELESAVIEPARQVGLEVDQDLVTQIIADVDGSPGSLPLLQYALTELWKQRIVNRLTLSAYTRLGGVKGTLQKQANEVYRSLSDEEQLIAKRIFLELTQLGEGTEDTRRQVYKRDLVSLHQSSELVDQVIQKLTDAKLVVTSELIAKGCESKRIAVVDVAHEALIRNWPLLREWINENRDALRKKRSIEENAQEWVDKGKPIEPGYLIQGLKLDAAEEFIEKYASTIPLSSSAFELVQASQLERDRQKAELDRQQLEKLEAQVALDNEKERTQILTKAQQRAKQIIRRGVIVLAIITPLALGASVIAASAFNKAIEAQEGTRLEQAGVSALRQFRSGELEALLAAMQSAQSLQNLIKTSRPLKEYPAISPLLALQKILSDIHEQNYFEAKQGEIKSAVFLPGGNRFITAGKGEDRNSTLQIWDLAGKSEASLVGHEGGILGGVNAVSVGGNAQNALIASAGEDGTVRLWNQSGKPIGSPLKAEGKHKDDGFTSISVSQDGQKIIAGKSDGNIYLWEQSGKLLKTWLAHSSSITAVAFSKNSQRLVTAGEDGLARIWTITGDKLGELKHPEIKKILGVNFSPDGQMIATASDDNRARIWTIKGQEIKRLEGHQGWVTVVNFSPDGQTVSTASDDGSVKLWNPKTGQKLQDFRGHRGVVWSASFSPDGKRLLSTGRDGFVRIWNLAEKPIQQIRLTGFQDDVNAIAFSPNGKTIVGAGNEGVMRLWDLSGKELKAWQEAIYQKKNVQDIAFSPDGKFIVASGLGSIARVWDLAGSAAEPQAKLKGVEGSQEGHQGNIGSVAVSPNSQFIATGSFDRTIRIWKPKSPNGALVAVTPDQEGVVSRVVFTADGQRLVSADWEGNLAIWDLAGHQLSKWQKVHQTQIRGLGITHDGSRIVTADKSGYVKILDDLGKIQKEFFSYQSGINTLTISPDGQLIATGGMDGTVRLWDFQGRQLAEFQNPKGSIWGIAFSPDSHQIALAGDKGFVQVSPISSLLSLMKQGCGWLQDYLESHPTAKVTSSICR